jgi:hypothetical protein
MSGRLGGGIHSVAEFEARLVEQLKSAPVPGDLVNEGDIERRVIFPIVREVLREAPGLHVYAHPWNRPEECEPNCTDGSGLVEHPELHGCPACWGESKKWGAARLYGLHCFDLIVGSPGDSFALEAKLLRRPGLKKKRANDGFQRLIGQCMLARLVHPRVVALCVAEEEALDLSATVLLEAVRKQGVTLVVRTVGGQQ